MSETNRGFRQAKTGEEIRKQIGRITDALDKRAGELDPSPYGPNPRIITDTRSEHYGSGDFATSHVRAHVNGGTIHEVTTVKKVFGDGNTGSDLAITESFNLNNGEHTRVVAGRTMDHVVKEVPSGPDSITLETVGRSTDDGEPGDAYEVDARVGRTHAMHEAATTLSAIRGAIAAEEIRQSGK